MMEIQAERLRQGIAFLAEQGLNLFAVLDIRRLPVKVCEPLRAAGIDLAAYQRLVVIGHAGRRLWERLAPAWPDSTDPIDDFSRAQAAHFMRDFVGDTGWQQLYPAGPFFPLNELGELVGWGRPSPLGLGIHPHYGLWWAYRVALVTQAALPCTVEQAGVHPCDSCRDKPCLSSCPAGALDLETGFDVYACSDYRVAPATRCGGQCLARIACPIGREHQYSRAQLDYHYGLSLATIKAYKDLTG